ncbi:receptor-like protein kinase ANXUR1 [Rutidosis leptorrhynchoides]|uniref:receptor-like protein kinase ANXUR1 n=1 Tax=Rutidosis leptorrhynchoides TaxID=125765 RepID=UPI003A993646
MDSPITELAHLKIPLQKIADATNNFSDRNLIGKGSFGDVYKGKLDHDGKTVRIAARRLDPKNRHGITEFWTEVNTLSSLQESPYMVELIGFCDENGVKIVVNRHYPKGSLARYISDPLTLDFEKRLVIAKYLVYGIGEFRKFIVKGGDYVLHRNLNSFTILIDDDWMPRLSGFEYSVKHAFEQRNQVVNLVAVGTKGYIDPAIEKHGGLNHMSDIYSVGIILFELLCGRRAFEDNQLLGPLAKCHYENGTLKDIINPDLWNQMNQKSFKRFSKQAYSCLQENPTLRPDTTQLWVQLKQANYYQVIALTEVSLSIGKVSLSIGKIDNRLELKNLKGL